MEILGIVVATMIAVALAVFAIEYYLYRKHHVKPPKLCATKRGAETREAPMAS